MVACKDELRYNVVDLDGICIYWLLVEGSGSSGSSDARRFLAIAFLSEPPMYFFPVRHRASCFSLT